MDRVPIFRPTIRREGMNGVLSCLVEDTIGPGERARELAATVADSLRMAGGVAFADYRHALECALATIGAPAGTMVVCSALAPQAHKDAVESSGLTARFVDVSADSGVMETDAVTALLDDAAAVLIDHTLGFIPNIEPLLERGLPLIEDATSSLCGYDGASDPGPRGHLVVISLSDLGLVTAGGGAIALARSRPLLTILRQTAGRRADPMPDMNAALALAQLKRYAGDAVARRSIRDVYHQSIVRTRHRALAAIGTGDGDESSLVPFSYPVVVADGAREIERYAAKARIETRRAFDGSIMAAAVDTEREQEFPVAGSLARRCMLFPLYPLLGEIRVGAVAKVLATLP